MSDSSIHDPAWQRFVTVMRSALVTYDAENGAAPDRHSPECPCLLCGIVRDTRRLVHYFDEATETHERVKRLESGELPPRAR